MSKIQTLAAALILMIGVTFGTFVLFKNPIPYAYDNLPNKLNQTMHKNGVHWAKIRVEGNEVFITGTAPNSGEMVLAKSLIQKEAGVSANFMGVEVKNIKTRDDFESEDDWEKFKKENPPGSTTRVQALPENNASSGSAAALSASAENAKSQNASATESTGAQQTLVRDDRYILNFTINPTKCETENRLGTEDYQVIYKGNTAVIDSRSLSDLDWIADLDETCPLNLKLFRIGEKDDRILADRKIDEVRYHLMSAGILSERIVTENK